MLSVGTQELRAYVHAARHLKTPNSQLEAELDTFFCRGILATCFSLAFCGYSWPSPSLVVMVANGGKNVKDERMAYRHTVLHMDLRLEKEE